MRTATQLCRGVLILTLAVVPWTVASAGDAETEDAPPTPNHIFGSGWNPTFDCMVEEGDTMDDILDCLADGISNPPPGNPCDGPTTQDQPGTVLGNPGGPGQGTNIMQTGGDGDCDNNPHDRDDFRVTRLPWPRHGIHIEFLDGSEIERLLLWENDPAIQMTSIAVARDGLLGRIRNFTERPSRRGGIVTVTVNGHPVSINTALYRKADDLTDELRLRLKDAGFAVYSNSRYLVLTHGTRPEESITSIKFESTDSNIASSDLALFPEVELLVILQDDL